MSAVREAIVLPVIFLTVTLLGGLRIGVDEVRLTPPPLMALTLGMVLLGSLARGVVFVPGLFLNPRRRPLENTSGAIVLLTLFAAGAQTFNLLTPERGLLHFLFSAFFLMQLLTTLAGTNGRTPMLRSLLVLLGSAFVLRFVILESLYAPGTGTLKRVLTVLLEGATLGTLEYESLAPATGYVAFATLTLYLLGLVLLRAGSSSSRHLQSDRPADRMLDDRREVAGFIG